MRDWTKIGSVIRKYKINSALIREQYSGYDVGFASSYPWSLISTDKIPTNSLQFSPYQKLSRRARRCTLSLTRDIKINSLPFVYSQNPLFIFENTTTLFSFCNVFRCFKHHYHHQPLWTYTVKIYKMISISNYSYSYTTNHLNKFQHSLTVKLIEVKPNSQN